MKVYSNEELSSDAYHAERDHVSSSGLKLILLDPREYYNKYVLNIKDEKKSDALSQGSHVHTAILEPEKLGTEYAIYPGAVRRGNDYEKFLLANDGKTVLTQTQDAMTKRLVDAFNNTMVKIGDQEVATSVFYTGGTPEESFFAEMDGIGVKVRCDYRRPNQILDVKTTSDALEPLEKIRDICYRLHYDLSAALYVDVVKLVTGMDHEFLFTFLSKSTYQVKTVKASERFLESGRNKYKEALKKLKKARETGIYFNTGIEEV